MANQHACWEQVDWSHLCCKERRHVDTLLKRRAWLKEKSMKLPDSRRSYVAAEQGAIDWALGLCADRAKNRGRGHGGQPVELRVRPIDDEHCHTTCEWGMHEVEDGEIVQCKLFSESCPEDPKGEPRRRSMRCTGCLVATDFVRQQRMSAMMNATEVVLEEERC